MKDRRSPFKIRTMITAIAIVAFLALTCLLAFGTGWNNVLSPDRNELVFADRNREYGAYKIRQEHHRTMVLALGIGLGLVGIGVVLPRLFTSASVEHDIPQVRITDFIFDQIVEPAKPVEPVQPQKVLPRTDPPLVPKGIPIAVDRDSIATAPKDTTGTGDPDPGPKGGDPGPKGGDPGPKVGGTGGGTGSDDDKPIEGYQADEMPEYPGGTKALYKYLGDEVEYPQIDVKAERSGRVVVGFVVLEDGTVSDATVLLGVSPTLDAEALRVVKKMKKWKPGKARGKDVKVRYKLPIVFTLAP